LEAKRKEFLERDRKALKRAGEEKKDRERLKRHLTSFCLPLPASGSLRRLSFMSFVGIK